MSSDSPRTRIDQFFASRKRRGPSSKDEKTSKDPRSPPDGSPGAKGTLDGYLAKSPDVGSPPTRLHTPGLKRNLTCDINLSSACAAAQNCSVSTLPSVAGENPSEERPCNQSLVPDPAKEASSTSNGGNLELRRFAIDFLSLYCSDMPSAPDVPEEQDGKGQKRNGSPSLLISCNKTCAKKQCIVDSSNLALQAVSISSAQGGVGEFESKIKEVTAQPMKFQESGGKDCMSLKRCTMTPNSGLIKIGIGVLGSSASAGCGSGTPKLPSRGSMFSPGDDFWNEAIQVVDGLFVPANKLPEDLCFLRSGTSTNKPLKDTLSNDAREARDVNLDGHGKRSEKPAGEDKMLSVPAQCNRVSQLPVKHFDFSQEECNSTTRKESNCCILEKTESVTHVGSVLADSSSLDHRVRHASSMFIHYGSHTSMQCLSEKPSPSNMQLDANPSDTSISISHILQCVKHGASDLAVAKEKAGSLVQEKNDDHSHDARNLSSVPQLHLSDKPYVHKERKSGNHEAGTPSSSVPFTDRLQLSNWLPSEVCTIYMKKGMSKLYPWQVDCLLVDGVLEKRNLVYCASTSAGKSFVAEILMLRRIIATGKIALLVLPYVSICSEKAEHLELLLEPLGKHVRSFYGNQGGGSLPKDTSVAVCTIEKANSLINRLLEESRLSEVGIIVIDELHMVGDQHRGYLLELILTKLRYASGEGNSDTSNGDSSCSSSGKLDPAHGLQIVGMSATMPNIASVADWLQARLYQTDFRPVPLEEYIKVGNTIYDKKLDVVRAIPKSSDIGGKDPDHIVELCDEVVQEGHSVLLFCSSRKGCESTARHVSRFLKKFCIVTREGVGEFSDASSAIEALKRCPAGLDPILEETLPSGVAYHHAGLTVEEREIIETCYRKGLVRVLTATSTLAAGVNLPARRVIFRQPRVGRDFIDGTRYKQMAGRAGRTGIDTKGESILICKADEIRKITAILNDSCPPLQSCLSEDKNGMTHAILEVVAGGIVQTAGDINRYVRCTLLNSTKPFQDVVLSAQDSLRWLCHKKFLEWNEETKSYNTTPLGRAAFGSSLTPEESLVVLDDLSRAREGFILASDLHLVYLVTPINVEVEPDWELYYERFMQLNTLDQSVGNRVGVMEPFLMRMAHGAPMPIREKLRGKKNGLQDRLKTRNMVDNRTVLSDEQILRVSKRFYVALMLSRLVQEVPVADVCEAFKVARGMIQALQENSGRFASMVAMFCERLGWHDLEGLVSKFQNRVSFGVRAEIVELTTIPYVKGSRARALFKAGLRTTLAIAEASVPEIAKALFESSAWCEQEGTAVRRMQLGIAKKIKNGARKIVLDQAEEARVAAYSAFRSLGLHVPQFSRPVLCSGAEGSSTHGGSTTSSGEDALTCYVGTKGVDAQIVNSLAVGDRSKQCTDTLRGQIPEPSGKIKNINVKSELNQNSGKQPDCHSVNVKELKEASSETCRPSVNNGGETSGSLSFPVKRACNDTDTLDAKFVHNQKIGDTAGGTAPNYTIGNSSEKGPINASCFPGGFDSFLDRWDAATEFYFDTHFLKRSERHSHVLFEIFGFAICWENSPIYYVSISKDLVGINKHIVLDDVLRNSAPDISINQGSSDLWEIAQNRWNRMTKIMGRNNVRKLTWNLKIQLQALKIPCVSIQRFARLGIDHKKLIDIEVIDSSYIRLSSIYVHGGSDMCLAAWILWPDEESKNPPNLEKVAKRRLLSGAGSAANRDGRWRNQMHKAAHDGCCRRVAQVRALGFALWKLLVSEDLVDPLTRIENSLVKVLADMELWGIGVDMEACLKARHILVRKLKELEKEAHTLAGTNFSLYNTADIANVLYRCLKLPIPKSSKKGKSHPSTDKHSLDFLRGQHSIIPVIKEHRTLAKLLNSTLGSICSRAHLCMKSQKYTIQGHWLQTSTATGRLSMEEPNLQCVEHVVVFTTSHSDRNSSSSSDVDSHVVNARDFFIPTEDNRVLLAADYSQIELRLMAHFSKDPLLIDLLSKPDGDVFTMLAARWMGKPESTISSQERDHTKRLVYGILYGMGTNSLAEQLECSSEEAAEKIQSFKASFPGVSLWLHETVLSCRHKGYVQTLMGRKRYLSKIKLGNNKEKAKAERQAVNSICQGSAADIIKIAMINIHNVIVEGGDMLKSNVGLANFSMLKGCCRILLQVHDELVLEVDSRLKKEAGILLQTSMESAVSLRVPLRVKLMIGRTWGSMETFHPDP